MNILGISCFYHDSAACLLRDGQIISAASEERFNRQKNSPLFPSQAAHYCLQAGDISVYDLDYVGFYEKPFLKFSRVVLSHLRDYPFSLKGFLDTAPLWLQDRLIMPLVFKKELGFEGKTLFIKHHLSHAASAFLVSPFDEAAILTADGVGEWATLTCGYGRGQDITITREMRFPDSLGLLYTAVTTFLGFEALEGEGKVMGLAGYGKASYSDKFKEIVKVRPDGSFSLDKRFFSFSRGGKMYTHRFGKMFGSERIPEAEIKERHCDIAASLQKFTEETLVAIARNLHRETGLSRLCLAGGLFLNCVANSRIMEEAPFKEIFVQPAAGDSGGALGVAAYAYYSLLKNPRNYAMSDAYLGPDFSDMQIKRILINAGVAYQEMAEEDLCKYAARRISENKIIGWFQGRMEFGPRALGNRSILADPRNAGMKELLNSKVKSRESFRPYAPAVLEERANEFFVLDGTSPFMLLSPRVRADKKSLIPAVTHIDDTARVQTVNRKTNPRFWALIKEFENITGIPLIINTSFNLRREPVVLSPQDALDCFKRSRMDCLVLGNHIVERH